MNEEQLADLLANQIDALLAGEPLAEALPDELAALLPLAQDLAAAAPTPRPEFGPALKESLLGSGTGGDGAAGSPGSAFNNQILLVIIIGGLVLMAVIALIVGSFLFGVVQAVIFESPTALPGQTQTAPARESSTPLPPTSTVAPTLTKAITPSASPSLRPTATSVLDILPPVTLTVEQEPPPVLVPGQGGGRNDGDDGGGRRGCGQCGDDNDD